ncbi:MAG TPA: hypothetical protein VGJ34_05385 [Gaiellaceae bacterium]
MFRRKGGEAPRRLLELALAADPVSSPGLVPRDGDVDEPLKEVTLLSTGGAPDVLQHLVRGEVLAALDQLEPAL